MNIINGYGIDPSRIILEITETIAVKYPSKTQEFMSDLGKYGMEIFKDYLDKEHDITLSNYNDCGVMLYDLEKQRDIHAGGSGPVCSALVVYSYIYKLMKKKKLKRVLFLATGALFSPLLLYQKENINSICLAISLEVV